MKRMIDRSSLPRRGQALAFIALIASISVLPIHGQSVEAPPAKAAKQHRQTSSIKMKLQRSIVTNTRIYTGSHPADCIVAIPEPVSAVEAEEAIRSGLENLNFGIDDPLYRTTLDTKMTKRSSNEQEHWTDVVELNETILMQSGTTLRELGLSERDRIYGYQVALTWITQEGQKKRLFIDLCHRSGPGIPMPRIDSGMAQVIQRTIKSPKTVVKLRISISIYERGTASRWVERSSSYEPKPLRNLVETRISDALNGTTRRRRTDE